MEYSSGLLLDQRFFSGAFGVLFPGELTNYLTS